jgi:transposase
VRQRTGTIYQPTAKQSRTGAIAIKAVASEGTGKRKGNDLHFDGRRQLYRISGVDLTQIDGIDALAATKIISEIGLDMNRWPSEKHFSSWLGLCPNNRVSGDKVLRRATRKVVNPASTMLRVCAQGLFTSKSALGAFARRMNSKLGPASAITAIAHKLAKLVYRLLRYGDDYLDIGEELYEKQYQERALKNLQRRARQLGFSLVPTENVS